MLQELSGFSCVRSNLMKMHMKRTPSALRGNPRGRQHIYVRSEYLSLIKQACSPLSERLIPAKISLEEF